VTKSSGRRMNQIPTSKIILLLVASSSQA